MPRNRSIESMRPRAGLLPVTEAGCWSLAELMVFRFSTQSANDVLSMSVSSFQAAAAEPEKECRNRTRGRPDQNAVTHRVRVGPISDNPSKTKFDSNHNAGQREYTGKLSHRREIVKMHTQDERRGPNRKTVRREA